MKYFTGKMKVMVNSEKVVKLFRKSSSNVAGMLEKRRNGETFRLTVAATTQSILGTDLTLGYDRLMNPEEWLLFLI